jgi:3'-phosphoadenosine 5'-phosphosulfate sulfotransferase (PAPS reductase)/FAD synthetase
MFMFGWCEECQAIAFEGLCPKHGETKPISRINSIDVCPLPEFEKEFLNDHLDGLKLGEGIFVVYGDREYRKLIVALDKPLVEIKVTKDGTDFVPLVKGEVMVMNPHSLYDANSNRLNRLVKVSKSFARQELGLNKNAIILFSAGKDSVVLAHLLEEYRLKKVFIDTGIEFPESYSFISSLKKEGWDIDVARAEKSFFDLLPEKGYPKYGNRWCCKTQKFAPSEKYIKEHFSEENVLVFDGERRWESLYRLHEPFKRQHRHIHNQYNVHIMIDWTAMDAWIYTWKNKLPVNEIYRYYDRSGCWPCPFGLIYRNFIMKQAHPKLHDFLHKMNALSNSYGVSIRPCTEGKSMKHLGFSDESLMNAVARLLPNLCDNFELHNDQNIICVPNNISRAKLNELVKKARANLIKAS